MGTSAGAGNAPRVCILGGGFGGLYTAIKLENLLWQAGTKPKVVLIDQGDRFVFKPLLYELLNGTATATEVAPPFAQVLAPYPIQFLQAKVASVEPSPVTGQTDASARAGGIVRLVDGGEVEYDWLVLALGSSVNTFGIPGVKELALPFVTYDDAMRLMARLEELEAQPGAAPEVVVVGAGYSGVELAAVLAERLGGRGRVRLVTNESDVLTRSPEGQRAAARAVLAERGVSLVTHARVTSIKAEPSASSAAPALLAAGQGPGGDAPGAAASSSGSSSPGSGSGAGAGSAAQGRRLVNLEVPSISGAAEGKSQTDVLEADVVLWTAGLGPSPRLGSVALPFPSNARGQTQVDETLAVLQSGGRIFALGDVAVCSPSGAGASSPGSGPDQQQQGGVGEQAYPATAQVAFQQADYVAWNVWCAINGRPRLPFRYQHLGEVMSLGKLSAAATLPIELPAELASSISSSPLGPLLSTAGVKIGNRATAGDSSSSTDAGVPPSAGADGKVTLEGPLAQAARRLIYLYRQPTVEQQVRVASEWAEEGARVALDLAGKVLGGAPGRRPDERR